MSLKKHFIVAGGVVALGVVAVVSFKSGNPVLPAQENKLAAANTDYSSKPEAARQKYQNFIGEYEGSKDPAVQDQVTSAKMHLAYISAKKNDYKAARTEFLDASKTYKGKALSSEDYGNPSDQAAYQAAVCLVGEGKNAEAEAEFVKIMKERPLSPVVHQCYGRLKRLNEGVPKQEWDDLLQANLTKREEFVAKEIAMCAPKSVEFMLKEHLLSAPDGKSYGYKELANLFKTNTRGTTIVDLKAGLKSLGFDPVAAEVNRADFAKLKAPFLYLQQEHYLAVLEVTKHDFLCYDPAYNTKPRFALPGPDDSKFRAVVVTFSSDSFNVSSRS